MKRLLNILVLITILAGTSLTQAQNYISVSGIVMSTDNGQPVPGHPVHIILDQQQGHFVTLTGPDGTFSDSVFVMGMHVDSLTVATIDCLFQWHEQVFTNLNEPIYAEFHICTDSLPGSCQADFSWEVPGSNPLHVSFTDLSTGNISQRLWDFGDGSFSTAANPGHTYPEAGEYMACLSIQSFDSLFPCYDIYCAKVVVGDSMPNCMADFTFTLDSSVNIPNQFIFTSTSTGNIDQYSWDFGDGTTGSGPQVVHQFPDEGEYSVCLTITGYGFPHGCSDQECKTVETPEYSFFGGQVFAGNFPLNNPTFSGDTGAAFLYRVSDDMIELVDTQYFYNELGLYAFNMVLPGNYLVKVRLTRNSVNFQKYFPTYYPQNIYWQSAGTLNLEGPIQNADIHLFPTRLDLPQGPGVIHGSISFNTEKLILSDPGNIEVVLLNEEMEPLTFTLTDPYGNFTFTGLEIGTYMVRAEETGWTSSLVEVDLSLSNPVSIPSLILQQSDSFSVEEKGTDLLFEGPWPNPASEYIQLRLTTGTSVKVILRICDMTGRVMLQNEPDARDSTEVITLHVGSLRSGIYLLQVISPESGTIQVKKFIR